MATATRELTNEVRLFATLRREGDVIPHGWNKKIGKWHTTKTGKKQWRSRPFAERLLARIVWLYTPTPITNNAGEVIGWKRKFAGEFWVMNRNEMADALGCSRRTISSEIELLRELGLINTMPSRARRPDDGAKKPQLFVVPIFDSVKRITDETYIEPVKKFQHASEETSSAASEETSLEPVKKLHYSSIPTSIPNTSIEETPAKLETPAATPPPPKKRITNTEHNAAILDAIKSSETTSRDIMDAYSEAFKNTPNWKTKTNCDILRELKSKGACRDKILSAAKFWKSEMAWCKFPNPQQVLQYWDAAMAFNAPAPAQPPAIRAPREIVGVFYDPKAQRQP